MYFLNKIFLLVLIFFASSVVAESIGVFNKSYESYNSKSDFYIPEIDSFFTSISFDDIDAVRSKVIVTGISPNIFNKYGNPALVYAIKESSPKVTNFLIDVKDSDLEIENIYGENPLMLAAFSNNLPIVKKLVDIKKVKVNKTGWSALHYAASKGYLEIVQFLISNGADVNAKSPNETTPLMMASRYGHIQVVRLLLTSGADLALQNQQGLTAIDFASNANQTEIKDGLISRWARLYGVAYK